MNILYASYCLWGRHRCTSLIALGLVALTPWAANAQTPVDVATWTDQFVHTYDYVLRETEGLAREKEPVEITLTMGGNPTESWRDHIRVVRIIGEDTGALVPHEVMGAVQAGGVKEPDQPMPFAAASINIIFLADCPANGTVTYRLFWGVPEGGAQGEIPTATLTDSLDISGEAPGLTIANEFYRMNLDPKSGAILRILPTGQDENQELFYHTIPIHFGTDIWSPEQSWDHDYDWPAPPNQKVEGGPLALRYYRWGPMHRYPDVEISITYTFYAGTPYVNVSSTLRLTKDRSSHAIRMGEIVVSHSRRPPSNPDPTQEESVELFTHYGWPELHGGVVQREINAHRNELGQASVEGFVPGGLGVLDRDIPWVAGYNADKRFGIATLRKHQFAGNYLGNPTPHSAPCTYLGQYGWGFVYWSRPMVYPLGIAKSALDLNTAVAAGTIFGTEEALLVFKPDDMLGGVGAAHQRYTVPLHFEFKGTGPW